MIFRFSSLVAVGVGCTLLAVTAAQADNYPSGVFIGAKGLLLKPYFESDSLGFDKNSGANNQLEIFNFDWDADAAYKVWIGQELSSGIGWSLSYGGLSQSTSFSRAEGTGSFEVHFDVDDDDAQILVNGTLIANNSLKTQAVDLEAWKNVMLPNMKLRLGGGVRYGRIKRNFYAYETAGNEFLQFQHEFNGVGPSLNYEVEVPIHNGFAVYNSARAAILFGKHSSSYMGEHITDDSGALSNLSLVPTLDTEIGLQWQGQVGALPGVLRLRAGIDALAWIGGGGWDFFHNDMGSNWPQNAGNFGLQGFSIGAQYTFALDGSNPAMTYEYDTSGGSAIVSSGFFAGAKAIYLTPYFETDILGADENAGANNSLEIFSFDWDGGGAYKAWVGYETPQGLGVSVSHMGLNHSTSFVRAEPAGGQIQVHFDTDQDDASIYVDGALDAKESLKMNVTDFDVWQKVKLPNLMLRYGAGARYANIKRNYYAFETGGDEFINFDHSFNGFGPSLSYEVEVPLPRPGFSLYNSAKGTLLFGEHKSAYRGEIVGSDQGFNNSPGIVPTLDTELGIQWRGYAGSGELTIRAGLEAQAWVNGGGFDLYDDDGGADFPQNAGAFGLVGFNVSASYKFGVEGQNYGMLERESEGPEIVSEGYFIGAKAFYLTPSFESDTVAYDNVVGAPLQIYTFDWDGTGAYRVWGGYESAQGFGVSLGHFGLNHSTKFSMTEAAGGNLQADFDPDSDDVDINVNGTLNAKNTLKIDATDLEAWQRVMMGSIYTRYGAGVRYARLNRSYLATETGGNEFIQFNHKFKGFGPSVNYEVEVPIHEGFSVYNFGRASLLFGEHKSNYQGVSAISDAGQLNNFGMVPTVDAELGIQWRGMIGDSGNELTLRAGVEAQAWVGGGGWNMHQDDGGAIWPQQDGSFGLYGFSFSAAMKF